LKKNLFSVSNSDFFTPSMLMVTLAPVAIIFAISIFFGMFLGENLISYSISYVGDLLNLDFNNLIADDSFFSFLKHLSFLTSIFEFFAYIIIIYVSWNLALIVGMIILGFFAPFIISTVQKRHYSEIELQGDLTVLSTIMLSVRILATTAVVAILGLVFFWIPVVNGIFFYLAFFYMFDKMLILDVSGEINTKDETKSILKNNRFRTKKHSVILYILSNIPFIGLLIQTYTLIYMSHYFFLETKEIR